ncbi:MAG: hypothetical protein AAGB26_04025 [Planctomycetota bacterium]
MTRSAMHLALLFLPLTMFVGCTKSPPAETDTHLYPAYTVTEVETGHQLTLNRITDTFYTGSSDVYATINLQAYPGRDGWLLTVYNLYDPTSPIYPSVAVLQADPNSDNPQGLYIIGRDETDPLSIYHVTVKSADYKRDAFDAPRSRRPRHAHRPVCAPLLTTATRRPAHRTDQVPAHQRRGRATPPLPLDQGH